MENTPEVWRWTEAHGRRLREIRIGKGMSQKEAAAFLRVSDDTLRNWESGATRPRDESLTALAEFSGVSVPELIAAESVPEVKVPPPPIEEENQTASAVRRQRIVAGSVFLLIIVLGGLGFVAWRRANTFKELIPLPDGIEAISWSGRVLWQADGVDPLIANRSAVVRMPGGRKLIACVLAKPGDFRPEIVSTLSFLEPSASHVEVVERVPLPAMGWKYFPLYARRYELARVTAIDLDGDGVDELIVNYQQVPECVSYAVLYEPAIHRARVVFIQTGIHFFAGAWDLDGNGKRDLLFLGINNGYDWMNALAAVRIDHWVGKPLINDETPVYSPDSTAYVPVESTSVFYTLLPRGRMPDEPAAVSWDAKRRIISVTLANGRRVALSAMGFELPSHTALPDAQRAVFREDAYRHDRESRRLRRAGFAADAVEESREAVASADRAGDGILSESMQRDLAQVLIQAGRTSEGESLINRLAARSENASEIFYDAAVAFHLAGDLRRAVAYYEAGIRRGGSPEAGKSKHEFIQGEVFALAELGAYREAEQAIDRVKSRYITENNDWTPMYREFVHWRQGEIPHPERIDVPPNATDVLRYWMLEFRNARGDNPGFLLRAVDALLAEENQPRSAIQSLRAVLLDRLGRHAEAIIAIREAMSDGRTEARSNIRARGHLRLIGERYDLLTRGNLQKKTM